MIDRVFILIGLALLLSGCGSGGGDALAAIVGVMPLAAKSMMVGIGDLVNRPDYGARLATYLDEIMAAGYKQQIRIVADRLWGPQFLQHGLPVLRAKGVRLVAILSPGNQCGIGGGGGTPDLLADQAWIRQAITAMRDVLVAVEICNEPWISIPQKVDEQGNVTFAELLPFPPLEFVGWNNALYDLVKHLAPDLPVWIGTLGHRSSHEWWAQVVPLGPKYDAISLHVYGREDRIAVGAGPPYYITETDRDDIVAAELFLYVWNEEGTPYGKRFSRRPGGGILPT